MVEVMVAALLVALAMTALASTASQAYLSITSQRLRQQAILVATTSIEQVRGHDYAFVATRPGDGPSAGLLDVDGAGPLGAETAIISVGGLVTGPTHHGSSDGLTWETQVTWVDDPAVTGSQDAKRVTVQVQWARGGQPATLRESTIISDTVRLTP